MSKSRQPFRRTNVTRAIKGAIAAGVEIARAEIEPNTGKIVIVFGKSVASDTGPQRVGRRRMTKIRLEYDHEFLDRHGKARRYFRRPGFRQAPLPGAPGSDEFMTAYQLALAGQSPPTQIGAGRTRPGSVNAAVVGYYNSLPFRSLALGTQKMRRAILERFRAEHGDKRIAMLPQEFIVRTLGNRSPAAARIG